MITNFKNMLIYNPNFNSVEFDGFKGEAGLHTFTLSVTEWCSKTNAIGIYSKRGKYGGTYAHKDIAFEFASSISPVFRRSRYFKCCFI